MSFSPLPPVGQAAMVASLPVVLASNQSSIPVTGTFYQATQPVSLASVPSHAVTNAGTFAVQVDNTVTVASHAVTNAGTFAVQVDGNALTALQLIDDTVAVLGTATYTEATTKGNIIAAVRRDADTTLVDTTNELAPLIVDARGFLKVEAFSGETLPVSLASVPSHAVTNAGTFAVQVDNTVTVASHAVTNAGTFAVQVDGNALTSLQLIDDAIVADDAAFTPATTKVMMAGFEYDDTTPDSVNEGDAGAARMSANRNIYVTLRDAAGNERGLNIDASGQVAVTLASAQTLATVTTVSTLTSITNWGNIVDNAGFTDGTTRILMNGYIYDEVAGTALTENDGAAARINANRAQVFVMEDGATRARYQTVTTRGSAYFEGPTAADAAIAAQPVTVGGRGSTAVPTAMSADGDVTNLWLNLNGATVIDGGRAHDAADGGAPIKVGGRARSSEITAVASDDRVDAIFDLVGKQIILPYSNPENFVSGAITTAMTGTTSTSLVAAPAAGLRNYITTIVCSNAHATVGTDIVIQDGSGGTTLMTIPAAAVYGGAVINLPVPLRQPTTATAIYCANVTTGASTKVSAVGYKGA